LGIFPLLFSGIIGLIVMLCFFLVVKKNSLMNSSGFQFY
jgi:hypothetical protein